MITRIFFDLDGTLLPMDQDKFVKSYLTRLARKMAPYGYDPDTMGKALMKGMGAMITNNGSATNEEVFWQVFNGAFGRDARKDEPVFTSFYENEFQEVRHDCGYTPETSAAIKEIHTLGYATVLATNPFFPAIATQSRVRWAGLQPEDFSFISTYENSSFCKPNPDYYREILGKLNLRPENCLMVGNDADEDMIAEKLGMRVFLLTDCLINRGGKDISRYPHGSFPELMEFIRAL